MIMRSKVKIGKVLFYFAWTLMIIHTAFSNSILEKYTTSIVTIVGISIFLLKIVIDRHSAREYMFILVTLCIGLIIWINTSDNRFMWMAISISAVKSIDINGLQDYTVKILSWVSAIIILSYIVLVHFSLIDSAETLSARGGNGMGFTHPNILHQYILVIMILYIVNRIDNISVAKIIALEVFNILVYCVSLSRTGLLVFTLITIALIGYKTVTKKKTIVYIYFIFGVVLIFMFTILPILFLNHKEQLLGVDAILNGRLWQGMQYYRDYGIHLFGNYMPELYEEIVHWYLDIGFFRVLVLNGIIAYILFTGGQIKIMHDAMKKNDYRMFFLIFVMVLMSLVESLGTYIFFNIGLLYLGRYIFKKNKYVGVNNENYIKKNRK